MKIALGFALLLAITLGGAACAEEDANFAVKYAPGFSSNGNTISIFGIFKDGRMSPESWDDLGPRFAAAFRDRESCQIAISSELRRANLPLFTAVDDAARQEGITDVLLDKFGPAAIGDSILVITIAGRPPKSKDSHHAETLSQAPTPQMMRGGGGRGRRGSAPRQSGGGSKPNDDAFEIFVSLFSTRQHQSVALMSMTYKGASEDEALTKFTEKLAAAFPGATCRPWNADVRPDEDAIRHLPQP